MLTGIHQKSVRRTIEEAAWPLLDITNNETKRVSTEREFWDVLKPSGHTQNDLVGHWCPEFGWDSKGPTSMHPPQRTEYTVVIFQISTTRSRQKHIASQAGDESACFSRSEGPWCKAASMILHAEMTQFMDTVIKELFEPMDVSDSHIFRILRRAHHNVVQWWAQHLAPKTSRPREENAIRFASCLVAIP